jgi:hypothetical protein
MDTIELPLVFATVGLVGLGGLAVLMGTAFCSLAELVTLVARRGGLDGGETHGHGRRPSRPEPASSLAWKGGAPAIRAPRG